METGNFAPTDERVARIAYSPVPIPLEAQSRRVLPKRWARLALGSAIGLATVCGLIFHARFNSHEAPRSRATLRAGSALAGPTIDTMEMVEAGSIVWIGCFQPTATLTLEGPGKYGFNSRACARECVGYEYMVMQDSSKCGCSHEEAVAERDQVFDGNCGDLCAGEAALRPTRYCGTVSNVAVYRLQPSPDAAPAPSPTDPSNSDDNQDASETEANLVGTWLFGPDKSRCHIERQQDGELKFIFPQPAGKTASGTLDKEDDDWWTADLRLQSGERVGMIRVKLADSRYNLDSNFKYVGEEEWRDDVTATKSGEDEISVADTEVTTWKVVTQRGLNIRSARDVGSLKLGTKWEGEIIKGRRNGRWLDLVDEPGHMLIEDNGEALLRRVKVEATTTSPPTPMVMGKSEWVVVTEKGLFVRDEQSQTATVLGSKVSGTTVVGEPQGNWLKLSGQPGYMMISSNGKTLLKPVSDTSAPTTAASCTDCNVKPPKLDCLSWTREGCEAITDRDTCLESLDGRKELSINGRKVHGQPCAWCGDGTCFSTKTSCMAFDPMVPEAGWSDDDYEVASCEDRHAEAVRPSVWCFALIMASGYEPGLLKAQIAQGVGIFDCDGYAVFSNVSMNLGSVKGDGPEVSTQLVPGSLSVPYGGKWYTALNTGIFLKVWKAVYNHGGYAQHDWVVKADADCVFFPSRLHDVLMREPMNSIPLLQRDAGAKCGNCQLEGQSDVKCSSHIQMLQDQGASCGKALQEANRAPPLDCNCECGGTSCYDRTDSSGALFLINCRFGLHGPIEVLSKDALELFERRVDECKELLSHPWGEDKYLDHCLNQLGVRRVLAYELLDETACGQLPVECPSANVGFHPFKEVQAYFDCWGQAHVSTKWPGDVLKTPAEETTGKLVIYTD
mmetsp:Transcript_97916/g.204224  ORF Transcript_97916/g.204224 Transcript_97916/m.204224 type:complete len:900 (+) Transcript_97916:190-2889(+)|eukprot:CAMPEP_0206428988 /NCGR_PEP_ID=MMETSP0324_2-20121206/5979_1 /ASSEMBLY_ACC=CAM_ASM_000836 /TAXON_ID=2866 /ORGANISM="Crypthecodinium cohnii, Strain Seligo" /LENGTH=899 /DNA_ID=CAMNT_0053894595 /DNA_START=104 /DNA_END=2803 /DNA_ORIENTATION=+